jgi:dTDP-4-dehydrorhamnose reductase
MRVLVTGASGQLGSYLLRALRDRGDDVVAWTGATAGKRFGFPLHAVDLRDPTSVETAFRSARPDVVLHTVALSSVAACRQDPARAEAVNVRGSELLARFAAQAGARLVHVSTDLVFDGERAPYRESDAAVPLGVYGRTKADAEAAVLALGGAAVVRVSLLYGPSFSDAPTLFDLQCEQIVLGRPMTLFEDEWRTPLDFPTAALGLLAVADSDIGGMLHLGGPDRLSRLEMGARLAHVLGRPPVVVARRRNDPPTGEPRPRDTSLDSSRWRQLFPQLPWPAYEEAVREMLSS